LSATPPPLSPRGAHGRTVLIVEDSRSQRILLRARLQRWGCEVIEAADGLAALTILRSHRVPMVISDWMMPGMTGPELCRALRSAPDGGPYTYVILLTAKHDKDDVAAGLSAGADDFLSKPVDEGELLARLDAGFRVIEMQERMVDQAQRIARDYRELRGLYETIDRDLRAASLLQRETLPPALGTCNGSTLAVQVQSAGHVGGDLVGYFPIGETGIGVYSIDVAGHGVASSLMTVRLAQLFDPRDPRANIAFRVSRDGLPVIRDPAEVMAELNTLFQNTGSHDLYFTMALAILDLGTGTGRICQAGHPSPALLGRSGTVRFLGSGGPPVGLLPDSAFVSEAFQIEPGGRLLLYSDGLTEAAQADGSMVDETGLAALLADQADLSTGSLIPTLLTRLRAATGRSTFDDDLSALLVERPCAPAQPTRRPSAVRDASNTSASWA
jgi:sigma-B regulation protein RsbU (phosphoserine phosphatase)